MPIIHEEIIEDLEDHIRKFGGERSEWWVGTAKDARAPFFRRHLATDLGDELIYREAFTTSAAQAVVDHLVNNRGLQLDQDAMREAELGSTLTADADLKVGATQAPRAVPEPGKIVFVYRPGKEAISHQLSAVSKGGTSLSSY